MAEEAMDVAAPAEPLPPFPTISILSLVKEAQQGHGLRHGDYARYRTYTSDKLRRLRAALGATHSYKCVKNRKAKFARKPVAEESFIDSRYVQIPLFETERRWAQAMAAKLSLEDNAQSRSRHAMRTALKMAVKHSAVLESLVKASARCDASTKLEAQAYALWLKGIVSFELKDWSEAVKSLKGANLVYEQLAAATPNSTLATLYRAKCKEIAPQLRLCAFNSAEGTKASMAELMELKVQLGPDSQDIDALIAEMRSKAKTDDAIPIEWAGRIAPAGDEKVRAVVDGWVQTDRELKECTDPKQKMALLEKQIADTRDAIDKINDGQRRKVAEGATGLDTEEASRLRGYLDFVRLSRTAERYLAIIENTKLEKKHKPQDLLRLYDSVIEILKEVMELPGAEDKAITAAYTARVEFYRAFRCFYMGGAYASLGRYDEATALYERAAERTKAASKAVKEQKGNKHLPEREEPLTALASEIDRATTAAKAERLTAIARGVANTDEKKAETIDNRPLSETLDEWREWSLPAAGASNTTTAVPGGGKGKKARVESAAVPIANFPPKLVPMPVKPIFFDLAADHIKMPDLSERMAKLEQAAPGGKTPSKAEAKGAAKKGAPAGGKAEPQQGEGIAGSISGWFWGKK